MYKLLLLGVFSVFLSQEALASKKEETKTEETKTEDKSEEKTEDK